MNLVSKQVALRDQSKKELSLQVIINIVVIINWLQIFDVDCNKQTNEKQFLPATCEKANFSLRSQVLLMAAQLAFRCTCYCAFILIFVCFRFLRWTAQIIKRILQRQKEEKSAQIAIHSASSLRARFYFFFSLRNLILFNQRFLFARFYILQLIFRNWPKHGQISAMQVGLSLLLFSILSQIAARCCFASRCPLRHLSCEKRTKLRSRIAHREFQCSLFSALIEIWLARSADCW